MSCAYRNRRIWIVSTPTYIVTHVSSVALDTCAPHTGTGVSGPFRGHELKYRGPRLGISPVSRMQVPSFSFSTLLIPLPSANPAQPHSFPERQPSPRERVPLPPSGLPSHCRNQAGENLSCWKSDSMENWSGCAKPCKSPSKTSPTYSFQGVWLESLSLRAFYPSQSLAGLWGPCSPLPISQALASFRLQVLYGGLNNSTQRYLGPNPWNL